MGSPIEPPPPPVLSRRARYDIYSSPDIKNMDEKSINSFRYSSQHQPPPIHNNSMSYPSSSQPIRQPSYSSISPPSVSPASFHHSPTSEYPSYTNSPISNGHGHTPSTAGAPLPRHDLPSIQTNQSRLSSISVDPAHNMGSWHTAPMMSSSVDAIEPFVRSLT